MTIAYSNLYTFIRRRSVKYAAASGTDVIKQFMHLSPETKEEVLEILLALMHKETEKRKGTNTATILSNTGAGWFHENQRR